MSEDIDLSIYTRTAIYRAEHSLNQKSKLYKIPLSWNEIFTFNVDDIQELAKTRRLDFKYPTLYGDGELEQFKITSIPKIKALQTIMEPKTIVSCIQTLYNQGPQEGYRNNTILRIASHFRRNGIPSKATKAALLEWNNGELEETLIIEKVEAVYNANYKYGCNDTLMQKFCNPKCIYYKRKDYLVDIQNAESLQEDYVTRMTTDWSGRCINIARAFGLHDSKDAIIYPGELVTIYGPTGVNKTALAQNIILGYDHANDKIVKEWQIPTLFLSLELSGWIIHRRNLQIVSDETKEYVNKYYKDIYQLHKEELDHITVQTVSPTIDQIKEKIRELQPACVIVDYIDLVSTHYKDEYAQVRYISHQLSSLAVNTDIIIIQLSQISREYSRREILDLYAGKGSGAIENASCKVLGLLGSSHNINRKIKMLKNSDGDLFELDVNWTPSWRLKKVKY